MRIVRHVIAVAAGLFILVGIPVLASGYPERILSGVDTLSSATVVIEQPSGEYVVLINTDRHTNKENLATWETFFKGEEIGFLFEDISCVVADSDAEGLELARSFQSRLPENQMTLRKEDAVLMLSKVKHGLFDVALLSKEVYDLYGPAEDNGSILFVEGGR